MHRSLHRSKRSARQRSPRHPRPPLDQDPALSATSLSTSISPHSSRRSYQRTPYQTQYRNFWKYGGKNKPPNSNQSDPPTTDPTHSTDLNTRLNRNPLAPTHLSRLKTIIPSVTPGIEHVKSRFGAMGSRENEGKESGQNHASLDTVQHRISGAIPSQIDIDHVKTRISGVIPQNLDIDQVRSKITQSMTPQIEQLTSKLTPQFDHISTRVSQTATGVATGVTDMAYKTTKSVADIAHNVQNISKHALNEGVNGFNTTIPNLLDKSRETTKNVLDRSKEVIDKSKGVIDKSISTIPTKIKPLSNFTTADLTQPIQSVAQIPLQITKDITTKIPVVASTTVNTITSTLTTGVNTINTTLTNSISAGVSTVNSTIAPLTNLNLAKMPLSQLQLLKLKGNIIKTMFSGIVPTIVSKTTTMLPIASIQAAIYTMLMLLHRHDKLLSSLNAPSVISQDLAANLQLFTALGTVVQQRTLVNYHNLFRSEPLVPKSLVIFLQRYLYLAISSYRNDPYEAFQIASRSGLDVELLHTSRDTAHINAETSKSKNGAEGKNADLAPQQGQLGLTDLKIPPTAAPPNQPNNTNIINTVSATHQTTTTHPDPTTNQPITATATVSSTESSTTTPHPPEIDQINNATNVGSKHDKNDTKNTPTDKSDKSKAQNPTPLPFLPEIPFFIYEDKTNGNIVVSIRGTDSLDDLITDIISWPRQLGNSYVHSGMFGVAQRILPRVLSALREILIVKYIELGIVDPPPAVDGEPLNPNMDQNGTNSTMNPKSPIPKLYSHQQLSKINVDFTGKPIPRIVFTGHSLGGGVAALMALMCRQMSTGSKLPPLTHPAGTSDEDHRCPLGNDIDFIHKHYPLDDNSNSNFELVKLLSPESIIFASPALVSPALSEEMKEFTISVLQGDDPVPHLSEYSINNFIGELLKEVLTRESSDLDNSNDKDKTKTNDTNKSHKGENENEKKDGKNESHVNNNYQHTPQNLIPGAKFDPYSSVNQQRDIINKNRDLKRYEEWKKKHDLKHHVNYAHFSISPDGVAETTYIPQPDDENPLIKAKAGITRDSKPVPKYVQQPPSKLSKVTSYIPPLVDASLRFHRMFSPAMFVQGEIKRHAKAYVKARAVDYAKSMAKDAIAKEFNNVTKEKDGKYANRIGKRAGSHDGDVVGQNHPTGNGHQHSFGLSKRTENMRHARKGAFESIINENPDPNAPGHDGGDADDDYPHYFDETPIEAYQSVIMMPNDDLEGQYQDQNGQNDRNLKHFHNWNLSVHPYSQQMHFQAMDHKYQLLGDEVHHQHDQNHHGHNHTENTHHRIKAQSPRAHQKEQTSEERRATISSTTNSLDQLAGEFSDFFNRYKDIIKNNISPTLYNALATLPIAPSEPSPKINPTHIHYKATTNVNDPNQTQTKTQTKVQPPSPNDDHDDDQHSNLAQVLPSQSQMDDGEVDPHKTPLDAIIPVPLTTDAIKHSFEFLTKPEFRRRVLFEDKLYVDAFGLETPRGVWKLDDNNNTIARMDPPGNCYYIKRIPKEVYLAAHQPIMVEEEISDEGGLGGKGEQNGTNHNNGQTDQNDQKPKKTRTVLTTVASELVNQYNSLSKSTNHTISKMDVEPSLEWDSETWRINPVTGLLNIPEQAINRYPLRSNEGIYNNISLTHKTDPRTQLGCDVDPNKPQMPTQTISSMVQSMQKNAEQQRAFLPSTDPHFPTEYPPRQPHNESQTPQQLDPNANHSWTLPVSFQDGFRHPMAIFPKKGHIDPKDPKSYQYIPQGNELIRALMGSTDSPAFPIITPLSASVLNPDGTIQPKADEEKKGQEQKDKHQNGNNLDENPTNPSQSTPTDSLSANSSTQPVSTSPSPKQTIETLSPILQDLHKNNATFRRRNDLMVGILNAVGETVATGDIAGATITNLKSISQQLESFKLIKSQEFVRIMVRRDAHEFSSLHLCDNMLWDHPSRAYVSAFEECLGNDTVTISSYSSPLNLHGLFGLKQTQSQQQATSQPQQPSPNNNTGNTANNLMNASPISTHPQPQQPPPDRLIIDREQVKPIVIGQKIHPDMIFTHHANSLRSLIPSLASVVLPPQLEKTIQEAQEQFGFHFNKQSAQQQPISSSSPSTAEPIAPSTHPNQQPAPSTKLESNQHTAITQQQLDRNSV